MSNSFHRLNPRSLIHPLKTLLVEPIRTHKDVLKVSYKKECTKILETNRLNYNFDPQNLWLISFWPLKFEIFYIDSSSLILFSKWSFCLYL